MSDNTSEGASSMLESAYSTAQSIVSVVAYVVVLVVWTVLWGAALRLHILQGDIGGIVITGGLVGAPLLGVLWYVVSRAPVGDWGRPITTTT